jgi:hypothetical protein
VTTNANPPELKLGQKVIHGDLQPLNSYLIDMNSINPNIEEGIKFQRRLSVKLN